MSLFKVLISYLSHLLRVMVSQDQQGRSLGNLSDSSANTVKANAVKVVGAEDSV